MKKHHPDNERVKRKYFIFLKEAKRQNDASVDAVAKAVSRFECYTKWRDFKAFHFEQAVGFKAHLEAGSVFQDARDVNTKGSKTFTTYFFPVGDEIHKIVREWVTSLKEELLFGLDDPLFPKTEVKQGAARVFEAVGVMPEHWSNATPIRKVFKGAFEQAGLPYFNPHSFRKTLVQLGETVCQSPEEFKAWSQNLGHAGVLTTFFSYGEVQQSRQSAIFKALQVPRVSANLQRVDALAKAVAREMRMQMESSG